MPVIKIMYSPKCTYKLPNNVAQVKPKCLLSYINKVNNDILTRSHESPPKYINYDEEYEEFSKKFDLFQTDSKK